MCEVCVCDLQLYHSDDPSASDGVSLGVPLCYSGFSYLVVFPRTMSLTGVEYVKENACVRVGV